MNIVTEFFAKHVNQIPSRGVIPTHVGSGVVVLAETPTPSQNPQRHRHQWNIWNTIFETLSFRTIYFYRTVQYQK
jgi:hypothetical protein